MDKKSNEFSMQPVGFVRTDDLQCWLEIMESYRPALRQLDQFSHVIVVWWAHHNDTSDARSLLQCKPPYAEDQLTGIFACRAEYRPNPIALTVCQILEMDEKQGIVKLAYIDALDGTPVLDLKAYFPVCDRVREARTPAWVEGWPQWVEDGYLLDF